VKASHAQLEAFFGHTIAHILTEHKKLKIDQMGEHKMETQSIRNQFFHVDENTEPDWILPGLFLFRTQQCQH